VDYSGRLTAHLPEATRLILVKADGSVLVHADIGSKALNWMAPPCKLRYQDPAESADELVWTITNKAGETLSIRMLAVLHDYELPLGEEPGLIKDGVEAHLQVLLAEQVSLLGEGYSLVRREFPTPIGPVDLMCRTGGGASVAVEIKRRGEIEGVEQLTRYLELLNRDSLLSPVSGVFAAQEIKLQARTLAEDRGIRCVVLDYEELRGLPSDSLRLF
jgi:RecB family endonuclease NucS